jgi:hypothetical protein
MATGSEPPPARPAPDLKTQLIVMLGALTAGAWLFVWAVQLIRAGYTVLGTAVLFLALLMIPFGRWLLGGGGQWHEDARKAKPRKPWHW